MKNFNMTLNKHIILRELHKSDREKLESLICEEWNYEKHRCPQVADVCKHNKTAALNRSVL